jgi:hypothetical protein
MGQSQLPPQKTVQNLAVASNLVQWVQDKLKQPDLSPKTITFLKAGVTKTVYGIRELNAWELINLPEAKFLDDNDLADHQRNIHQLLYLYDYKVESLFEEYIQNQSAEWRQEYDTNSQALI